MNYLAHGYRVLDDPYALAGTALPDWLGAADRRARLRRERIRPNGDPREQSLARGVVQHLDDDSWFHATEAFQRVSGALTELIADAHADPQLRAWFLGHVLLEMLLDRHLMREEPRYVDRYYAALDGIDAPFVRGAVAQWTTRPPLNLREYMDAFLHYRFLYGYRDDDGLFRRLCGVAKRARLPELPGVLQGVLPEADRIVGDHAAELLRAS